MCILKWHMGGGMGGSERHLLDILPALGDAGMDVRVCVLGGRLASPFCSELDRRGIRWVRVPAGPDANPALVWQIARSITAFRPDLVHTHLVHADVHGQLAARIQRTPSVLTLHGTHTFYRRIPVRWGAQLAGHLAARVIAVSEHVARFARDSALAAPGRVRVVRHGVDVAAWSVGDERRSSARRRLALRDEVVLGVASRLVEHKGHRDLLAAFDLASRREPSLRLLVAGEGPLRAELEAETAASGTPGVRFLGFTHDMAAFMAACDAVVVPTSPLLNEGFGLAALEAQAAGRPVVATRVGALPEIVVDEQTGLIVPADDRESLSRALVELARDGALRARLGSAGRERAARHFSFGAMVEGTLRAYAEASSEASSRS